MATHQVLGGIHSGMPFIPTNGVAAKQYVEAQIAELRERGVKNPRGRYLDNVTRRRNRRRRLS